MRSFLTILLSGAPQTFKSWETLIYFAHGHAFWTKILAFPAIFKCSSKCNLDNLYKMNFQIQCLAGIANDTRKEGISKCLHWLDGRKSLLASPPPPILLNIFCL